MTDEGDYEVLKYAKVSQISADLKRDSGVDLDALLADDFKHDVRRDGLAPHGEPTTEWLDLEAPENTFMRAMNTFQDPKTGEDITPPRWVARTSGLVLREGTM